MATDAVPPICSGTRVGRDGELRLAETGAIVPLTIPHALYMAFQATFCIITAALISGAIVERMRFSAYLTFITLWSVVVYAPRGFVKIISAPATGVVLGGSIVGHSAAELISVLAVAVTNGLKVNDIVPPLSRAQGRANRPFSRRFASKHSPVPSKYRTFARRQLRPTNRYTSPRNRSWPSSCSTIAARPLKPRRMSTGAPYANTRTARVTPIMAQPTSRRIATAVTTSTPSIRYPRGETSRTPATPATASPFPGALTPTRTKPALAPLLLGRSFAVSPSHFTSVLRAIPNFRHTDTAGSPAF